jgi:hypothetical protein
MPVRDLMNAKESAKSMKARHSKYLESVDIEIIEKLISKIIVFKATVGEKASQGILDSSVSIGIRLNPISSKKAVEGSTASATDNARATKVPAIAEVFKINVNSPIIKPSTDCHDIEDVSEDLDNFSFSSDIEETKGQENEHASDMYEEDYDDEW